MPQQSESVPTARSRVSRLVVWLVSGLVIVCLGWRIGWSGGVPAAPSRRTEDAPPYLLQDLKGEPDFVADFWRTGRPTTSPSPTIDGTEHVAALMASWAHGLWLILDATPSPLSSSSSASRERGIAELIEDVFERQVGRYPDVVVLSREDSADPYHGFSGGRSTDSFAPDEGGQGNEDASTPPPAAAVIQTNVTRVQEILASRAGGRSLAVETSVHFALTVDLPFLSARHQAFRRAFAEGWCLRHSPKGTAAGGIRCSHSTVRNSNGVRGGEWLVEWPCVEEASEASLSFSLSSGCILDPLHPDAVQWMRRQFELAWSQPGVTAMFLTMPESRLTDHAARSGVLITASDGTPRDPTTAFHAVYRWAVDSAQAVLGLRRFAVLTPSASRDGRSSAGPMIPSHAPPDASIVSCLPSLFGDEENVERRALSEVAAAARRGAIGIGLTLSLSQGGKSLPRQRLWELAFHLPVVCFRISQGDHPPASSPLPEGQVERGWRGGVYGLANRHRQLRPYFGTWSAITLVERLAALDHKVALSLSSAQMSPQAAATDTLRDSYDDDDLHLAAFDPLHHQVHFPRSAAVYPAHPWATTHFLVEYPRVYTELFIGRDLVISPVLPTASSTREGESSHYDLHPLRLPLHFPYLSSSLKADLRSAGSEDVTPLPLAARLWHPLAPLPPYSSMDSLFAGKRAVDWMQTDETELVEEHTWLVPSGWLRHATTAGEMGAAAMRLQNSPPPLVFRAAGAIVPVEVLVSAGSRHGSSVFTSILTILTSEEYSFGGAAAAVPQALPQEECSRGRLVTDRNRGRVEACIERKAGATKWPTKVSMIFALAARDVTQEQDKFEDPLRQTISARVALQEPVGGIPTNATTVHPPVCRCSQGGEQDSRSRNASAAGLCRTAAAAVFPPQHPAATDLGIIPAVEVRDFWQDAVAGGYGNTWGSGTRDGGPDSGLPECIASLLQTAHGGLVLAMSYDFKSSPANVQSESSTLPLRITCSCMFD